MRSKKFRIVENISTCLIFLKDFPALQEKITETFHQKLE